MLLDKTSYIVNKGKLLSYLFVFTIFTKGLFAFLNRNIANHIYAFEPLPEYLDGLEKTFANSSNVSIMKFALSDKCGDAYLKRAGIRSCITMEQTDTRVGIETIDSVCKKLNISVSYNILRYLKDLVPSYNFLLKGIEERKGAPVMLHAWIKS